MKCRQIRSVCLLLLWSLLLLPLLSGCSLFGEQEITFHDLTITLDADFRQDLNTEEDVAVYYNTSRVQIELQRTTFLTLADLDFTAPALLTAEEFRDMLVEGMGIDVTFCEVDGILAFVYEFEADGSLGSEMYKSLCCIYKSDSAFWCVWFDVPFLHYEQWEAQFYDWAKTVRFADSHPGVYVP